MPWYALYISLPLYLSPSSLTVISGRLEGRVAHLAFDVPQAEVTETVEIVKTLVEGIQAIERRAAPSGGGTVGPVAHPAGQAPAAR